MCLFYKMKKSGYLTNARIFMYILHRRPRGSITDWRQQIAVDLVESPARNDDAESVRHTSNARDVAAGCRLPLASLHCRCAWSLSVADWLPKANSSSRDGLPRMVRGACRWFSSRTKRFERHRIDQQLIGENELDDFRRNAKRPFTLLACSYIASL